MLLKTNHNQDRSMSKPHISSPKLSILRNFWPINRLKRIKAAPLLNPRLNTILNQRKGCQGTGSTGINAHVDPPADAGSSVDAIKMVRAAANKKRTAVNKQAWRNRKRRSRKI